MSETLADIVCLPSNFWKRQGWIPQAAQPRSTRSTPNEGPTGRTNKRLGKCLEQSLHMSSSDHLSSVSSSLAVGPSLSICVTLSDALGSDLMAA
eukprot:511894-Amphidinium_carterae.1